MARGTGKFPHPTCLASVDFYIHVTMRKPTIPYQTVQRTRDGDSRASYCFPTGGESGGGGGGGEGGKAGRPTTTLFCYC